MLIKPIVKGRMRTENSEEKKQSFPAELTSLGRWSHEGPSGHEWSLPSSVPWWSGKAFCSGRLHISYMSLIQLWNSSSRCGGTRGRFTCGSWNSGYRCLKLMYQPASRWRILWYMMPQVRLSRAAAKHSWNAHWDVHHSLHSLQMLGEESQSAASDHLIPKALR